MTRRKTSKKYLLSFDALVTMYNTGHERMERIVSELNLTPAEMDGKIRRFDPATINGKDVYAILERMDAETSAKRSAQEKIRRAPTKSVDLVHLEACIIRLTEAVNGLMQKVSTFIGQKEDSAHPASSKPNGSGAVAG